MAYERNGVVVVRVVKVKWERKERRDHPEPPDLQEHEDLLEMTVQKETL